MADMTNWAFPENLQPTQHQVNFDLTAAFEAVVKVHSQIPEEGFTAAILGTERVGNGVVIDEDGLVLTIGYLVTEAESIWLTTTSGAAIPATALAYDFATGFGLVLPLGRTHTPLLERGSAASVDVGDDVIVIGHGGRAHALNAKIADKREFAGYWEYVLDEAIFTSPAHPQWGGAALVSKDGRLLGIGSLLVEDAEPGQQTQGNMIVPIDLLEPILADMRKLGRSRKPPRPWLGMYTTEAQGQYVVAGVAPNGPAERAGILQGDIVLEIAQERPSALADLFRKVWRLGPAGTEIPLAISREGKILQTRIRSGDRNDFLFKPPTH
jgi:S1-C subfamily serine protease